MNLGVWGEFFLKTAVLLAGIYVIVRLTPRLANLIDRRKSKEVSPEEKPRPERVEDEDNQEKSAAENDDKEYKKE